MKAYLEENAWLSCSFDLAGTPQQLLRHFEEEDKRVQYSSGLRLLTIEDKVTKIKFECKIPAKLFGGLGAILGGIAAGVVGGLVIGAFVIFGGPVGWAIAGTIVAGVIMGGVGGIAGTVVASITHDCSGCQQNGSWQNEHKRVKFKGEKPILYNHSFLECGKKGGILLPSPTQEIAQDLSNKMKWNVRGELGLQILSQSLQGLIIGYGTVDELFTKFDTDFRSVPIAVGEYLLSDGVLYYNSPEESLMLGGVFAGASFIPGMPGGNELTSWQDWATTLAALGIEYGSNKIEEVLSNNNATTNAKGELGGILGEEINNSQTKKSGKSIFANL